MWHRKESVLFRVLSNKYSHLKCRNENALYIGEHNNAQVVFSTIASGFPYPK